MNKNIFELNVIIMLLLFLSVVMAFGKNAVAAETDTELIASGACGEMRYAIYEDDMDEAFEADESVQYRLYTDGTMVISGNGKMGDFNSWKEGSHTWYIREELIPWYDYRNKIRKVVVEEGVTTIGSASFYGCKNLESVKWADSIEKVGNSAFYKCNSLKEVKLPSHVKKWGKSVFAECRGLKKVFMDEDFRFDIDYVSEKRKKYVEGLLPFECDGKKMFSGCTALEEVKLPKDIPAIPSYFVEGCTALKTFPVPDNVIYWGSCPPSLCRGKYVLPDSVQTIGSGGFAGCSDLTELVLPDGLVYIGKAFEGCSSLKTVEIPESVRELRMTFYNCTGLESIVIPDTVQEGLNYGSSTMDCGVFEGCSNLKSVVLPNNMECIGSYLFKNCTSLKKIKLPQNLTAIYYGAFSGCSGLTEIKIPDTVEDIENGVFYGCKRLNKIKLPSNLRWLGSSAFYGCTSLEEADIPKGMTDFYVETFYNCKNLKSITVRAKKSVLMKKCLTVAKSYPKLLYMQQKLRDGLIKNYLTESTKKSPFMSRKDA